MKMISLGCTYKTKRGRLQQQELQGFVGHVGALDLAINVVSNLTHVTHVMLTTGLSGETRFA